MSEQVTDLQLSFDFAETEDDKIHGERRIAAPVDHSLEEDDEENTDPVSVELSDDFIPQAEPELISETIEEPNETDDTPVTPSQKTEPLTEPSEERFHYSEFAGKEIRMNEETTVRQDQTEKISAPKPEPKPVPAPARQPIREMPHFLQKELQRAALAWLASEFPTAAATRVPTRLAKFRADAAAFWSTPKKNRLLQPERTVLVEARATRSSCWPECSGSEEIAPQLVLEQERRFKLEAEIRKQEPHLLDSDVLFPEIEYWNYSETKNPEYRKCLQRIREYEHALYRGSRFERIHRANVANELYLAVPEGVIHPNELAEGWGLLYVSRNLSVKVIKKAATRECPQENLQHLSQNIAASSLNDVLFAHGIYLSATGKTAFRHPPRRRRLEHFV